MAKAVVPPTDILSELVDQFGPLRQQVDDFRPTLNSHDRIWEKLKLHIVEKPKDQPIVLKGRHFEIEIDACQFERKVIGSARIFEMLKKAFGATRFWSLVKFPLGPVDAMYSEEERKFITETTQTGARKIIAVRELDGPAKLQRAA